LATAISEQLRGFNMYSLFSLNKVDSYKKEKITFLGKRTEAETFTDDLFISQEL
jgi:hypothetical protein